jgi:hypothetical protein
MGFQNTLSEGIISGLRNGLIQMSAPISPGSSGGPLFDRHGNVVGISVAFAKGGENLNFAVPINWAKAYLDTESLQTLAEVAAGNTVTEDVFNGTVTIPAKQLRAWNINLDPNRMSNAEVHGQINSAGGLDGKITLALYYQGQPLYSCHASACAIHQEVTGAGTYVLALDNRISPVFGRTVTGQISLKYVR